MITRILFSVALLGILVTTFIYVTWGDAYWTWAVHYSSGSNRAIALVIAACDLIAVGLVLTAAIRLIVIRLVRRTPPSIEATSSNATSST